MLPRAPSRLEPGLPSSHDCSMRPDPDDSLRDELDSGERTLWSGEPRQGVILRGADVFLIPFSVVWASFAVFWEGAVLWMAKAAHSVAPLFIGVFGVPFLLVGAFGVYEGLPWPGLSHRLAPCFERIADARAVYRKIRDAQAATR